MSRTKKKKQTAAQRSNKPNFIWPVVVGALLLVAAAAGVLALRPQQVQVTQPAQPVAASLPDEITITVAADKRDSGAFMLDVREPDEWDEFHMPGATLIPLGELEARLDEVPADQEIVVVCRSGNRSATGRDILKDAGFSQVTSMGGGMRAWSDAGYPTVTGP
jgi:rhodanese-related sulfurtransferase